MSRVSIALDGGTAHAELESGPKGELPTLIWANQRFVLPDNVLTEKVVLAIHKLAGSTEKVLVRAVPYELTAGHVNGLLDAVVLDLAGSRLHGLQVNHVRCEFKFSVKPPLATHAIRGEISTGLDGFRPSYPASSPYQAVPFGDSLLPIVVLSREQSEVYDEHGNQVVDRAAKPIKEWRIRAYPAHQRENAAAVDVIELSASSVVFLEQADYEEEITRLKQRGLQKEEAEGLEILRLKQVSLAEAERTREATRAAVEAKTKNEPRNIKELTALLASRERAEKTRAESARRAAEESSSALGDYVKAWLVADDERAPELRATIDAMKSFTTDDLKELFRILADKELNEVHWTKVKSLVEEATAVEESYKAELIAALNEKETRAPAAALLRKFPPEGAADLVAVAKMLRSDAADLREAAQAILEARQPRSKPQPELTAFHNELISILVEDPNYKAVTVATKILPISGPTEHVVHQLLQILASGSFRTRGCAQEALKAINPSSDAVNLALVKLLADAAAWPNAKFLLLEFRPVSLAVQEELTKLLGHENEDVRKVAAAVLQELPADEAVMTDPVRAAIERCTRKPQ